ncbi:hypothetical protein ACROSR_17970, partial [Roseovarius tibetensis]|uniref:hypothetical protein n=1 Tax=Roseovarius tibetensis TaxID=2685897 RepID=UPI003D7F2B7D
SCPMAPRPRPLLTPPNDGTQKENRLYLRMALIKGAGHFADAFSEMGLRPYLCGPEEGLDIDNIQSINF